MDANGKPDTDAFTPAHGSPVSTSEHRHADGGYAEALRAAGEVPYPRVTT